MPYVTRDGTGRIAQVHATKTETARERVAPSDPELRAFLLGGESEPEDLQKALDASDLQLIRVLEDLITVLIDKRIIVLTDLPKAAQAKLAQRYELRSKLADIGGIVADSDEILLP